VNTHIGGQNIVVFKLELGDADRQPQWNTLELTFAFLELCVEWKPLPCNTFVLTDCLRHV
jgi:hypothetical protein